MPDAPLHMASHLSARARNDPGQYDDLADQWWSLHGTFAMLHWIAEARARLVPPAAAQGKVLVDVGCGGGLFAPHAARLGYRHIGVDITGSALRVAGEHGTHALRANVLALPLADGCADVVVAGEILEHVVDMRACAREACRVLRPGGTLVVDTIASTWLARVLAVSVAERIPGGAPRGLHDPALFVDRRVLRTVCAGEGVDLVFKGLRPSFISVLAWLAGRRPSARMVPTPWTSVLFQAWGTKKPS
ncbi:MAG TPA: methyltransferase domain-containing protein [Acidimicrobiales bacterium]|nr:methyltransferase domain-containing protein [Acidimicrobiales bacterium]